MSSTAQCPERFLRAKRLVESGEYEAATKYCVLLWRENDFTSALTVRQLVPQLAAKYEPARVEFTKLRDGLTSEVHTPRGYVRWIQLCNALDDGAPVVKWLETAELDVRTVQSAIGDERVYKFAERAGALTSFTRLVDLERIERSLRDELRDCAEDLGELLAMGLVMTLELPRKALLAVGRVEDEEKLAALIEQLVTEFEKKPNDG